MASSCNAFAIATFSSLVLFCVGGYMTSMDWTVDIFCHRSRTNGDSCPSSRTVCRSLGGTHYMEQAWSAIEVKLKQRGLSAGHSAARCHREGTCSGRDHEARAVTTAVDS